MLRRVTIVVVEEQIAGAFTVTTEASDTTLTIREALELLVALSAGRALAGMSLGSFMASLLAYKFWIMIDEVLTTNGVQ